MEQEHPPFRENILSAMGNIDRPLTRHPRYLNDNHSTSDADLLPSERPFVRQALGLRL